MIEDDNKIQTVDTEMQEMTQNEIAIDRHKRLTKKILDSKQTVTSNVRQLTLLAIRMINALEDINIKPDMPKVTYTIYTEDVSTDELKAKIVNILKDSPDNITPAYTNKVVQQFTRLKKMKEELEQYLDIIICINDKWSLEKAFIDKTVKEFRKMMTAELDTIRMAKVNWSNF